MARPLHEALMRHTAIGAILLSALPQVVLAVGLAGGGPKRTDCFVELQTNGVGYPAGARVFTGTTCADGDPCDADGVRNGVCLFTPTVCLNAADAALPRCAAPAEVASISFKGRLGKSALDTSSFDAAVGGLGLPSGGATCSPPAEVAVPIGGPDRRGDLVQGKARIKTRAKTTKGADKDRYLFVCRPGTGPVVTTSTTSTTIAGATTTLPGATTTTTLPSGIPGAGLSAAITGATIDAGGQVVVTFRLTDAAGLAVAPNTAATSNPNEARVRFTIARLEVLTQTVEAFTTTFTRYVSYITGSPASGSQPTYDTTGSFALVDVTTGTWTYTFGRTLPADLPRNLTHTLGAQIERSESGTTHVANPTFDFVPNGSPVVTVREVTTTAQCNACHDPLAVHGGGRREVKLCQLCHTDQSIDPQSGNEIDLKHMVHKIHMGIELPSVSQGPVGTKYAFIGFQDSEITFVEKVNVCASGPRESVPCESDADCDGGTCTAEATVGIGFPQDVRNCGACHAEGATAADHRQLPSTLACTGCHDDVNPSETERNGLPPGTGHVADDQPEAYCRLCHTATQGEEFDESVPGAHVIPLRSATLPGLQAELLSATGAPGAPVTVTFRLRDGAGTAITDLGGFNRVGFALSGPTTDFGATTPPVITPTAAGGGASGTLSPPDGQGVFTYTTAASLPANAVGSWRIGLEARRNVSVNGANVSEAAQNPVLDFSVDGSPVVARREVVDQAKCATCHGTFSVDFSVHGNLRNQVEYCVVCHNPSVTDFARRRNATGTGGDPANASINLKQLIHKIHRGEDLDRHPYLVYGFGSAPKNYTAFDFSHIRFPGDLRDCESCHNPGTQTLPLPAGLLPTLETIVDAGAEQVVGAVPPVTDACTSCHDSEAAAAHAETNTTASGAEACAVCHGEGSALAVTAVHAAGGD